MRRSIIIIRDTKTAAVLQCKKATKPVSVFKSLVTNSNIDISLSLILCIYWSDNDGWWQCKENLFSSDSNHLSLQS